MEIVKVPELRGLFFVYILVNNYRVDYSGTMKNHLLFFILCISFSVDALAQEVYRSSDEEGGVSFSDKPTPGAEPVKIEKGNFIPLEKVAVTPAKPDVPTGVAAYESVSITSPADQEKFHDNVGDINVSVSLTPALQSDAGHRLKLIFDGSPVSEPGSSTTFELRGVDRGEHSLQAVVVNDQDAEIAQSPVATFFLHKAQAARAAHLPARRRGN